MDNKLTYEEAELFFLGRKVDFKCPICHQGKLEPAPTSERASINKNMTPHDPLKLYMVPQAVDTGIAAWRPYDPNIPTPMIRYRCSHCGFLAYFDYNFIAMNRGKI